jgi:hypothetical protein
MLSELKEKYPDMTVEYLSIIQSDHDFNLINRDPLGGKWITINQVEDMIRLNN